jgi:hypothetical protein
MTKPPRRPRGSPASPGYEIGYAKPPKQHQFRPGQSGNRGGRRKGTPNKPPSPDQLARIIAEEGLRFITVTEGGEPQQMETARAIMRRLWGEAARGNLGAAKFSLNTLAMAQDRLATSAAETFQQAFDYKMYWSKVCEERLRQGLPPLAIYPHPDSIILDFEKKEAMCISPTPDEIELNGHRLDQLYFYQTVVKDIVSSEWKTGDMSAFRDDLNQAWWAIALMSKALELPFNDAFTGKIDHEGFQALKARQKKAG